MKIICFIVVLVEIMKQVHSLNCSVHEQDEEQQPAVCKPEEICGYSIMKFTRPNNNNTIFRGCLSKDGKYWKLGKCIESSKFTYCACDTDYCNNYCSAVNCPEQGGANVECDAKCKAGDATTTKPTDATTTNKTKTNPTDDNARATSDDGPQPTYDSTGATDEGGPQPTEDGTRATGEEGPQPTEDRSGATAEDSEETQKPTGNASNNSGNLRVVEPNQFLFELLILTTLVIRSSY